MTETIDTIQKAKKIIENETYEYKIRICEEIPQIFIFLYDDEKMDKIYNALNEQLEIYPAFPESKSILELCVPNGYEEIDSNNFMGFGCEEIQFYSLDELDEIFSNIEC